MNPNINFLKGLLIIALISGHVIQGPVSESYFRYLIYIFHMPVFIGISGFLLNQTALNQSMWVLYKKYKNRLIVPWLIASFLFSIIASYTENTDVKGFIYTFFIRPYYHLWYIPALLSYILLLKYLDNRIENKNKIIAISIFIYIIGISIRYFSFFSFNSSIEKAVNILLFSFKPYYFIYFLIGVLYKRNPYSVPNKLLLFVIFSLFSFASLNWKFSLITNKAALDSLIHVPINVSLIILLLNLSINNSLPRFRLLEWIGINSLAIFLYHVIPIALIKFLLNSSNSHLFYPLVILFEVLTIVSIYLLSKHKSINSILFGISILKSNELNRNK